MRSKIVWLSGIAALAIAGNACAANVIQNPGFEDPLGSEWTFTIVSGSSAKWTGTRTSALAHSGGYSYYMAFGPAADYPAQAYLQQVVTGLTPGIECTIKGWINYVWRADKGWAYLQALGGGAPVSSPSKGANVVGSWREYTVTQTADASGNLTVRLWLDKYASTTSDKTVSVYFDDVSVEPIPEPGSMIALLTGIVALAAVVRRRR